MYCVAHYFISPEETIIYGKKKLFFIVQNLLSYRAQIHATFEQQKGISSSKMIFGDKIRFVAENQICFT